MHPDGYIVRGVSITLRPVDSPAWKNMWSAWPWSSWIQPQIEYAVKGGANTIRAIGTYVAVLDGTITQATLNLQWDQLVSYCISRGLAVYPAIGDDFNPGGTPTYTPTQLAPSPRPSPPNSTSTSPGSSA